MFVSVVVGSPCVLLVVHCWELFVEVLLHFVVWILLLLIGSLVVCCVLFVGL